MKSFATIQELWDYCERCPLCQANRDVSISIGPEHQIRLLSFTKNQHLLLRCQLFSDKYEYQIDCQDNTFTVSGYELINKSVVPYIYLQSSCSNCVSASTYSHDMLLMNRTKVITDIFLERESFALIDGNTRLSVNVLHTNVNNPRIMISAIFPDQWFHPIDLPLFDLDVSDQVKAVQRIKNLMSFS